MTTRNNPTTWDQYERGGFSRTGSTTSLNRSGQFETESLLGRSVDSRHGDDEWVQALRQRRSSFTSRLAGLTEIGGVNSIRNFTRSWQRAAGFTEVIPQRPSFIFAADQAPIVPLPSGDGVEPDVEATLSPVRTVSSSPRGSPSLIRQQLEAAVGQQPQQPSPRALSPEPTSYPLYRTSSHENYKALLESDLTPAFRVGSHTSRASDLGSIFAIPPHLATPSIVGSYGSAIDYGTIRSNISRPSMAEAAAIWHQQQEVAGAPADSELPPILVKEVEQDGKIVLTVEGQSTLPQTVFNSTNVLIGVGLLSLPMGIKYAGWLCGMISLFLCAAVTAWTAKILARCMDLDPSLITFSDIAFISFGRKARMATSILFTLELVAACVALMVLFADSLALLFPGVLSVTGWKIVCALILMPLNFLPLRLLSFTSVIGIFSCLTIVLCLILDGFIKPTSPGSLLEPAKTYLFPSNWLTLPLSFGLLMSPWGGHSVFPNIYRDMRHPYRYNQALKITFSFTYLLDTTTAVAGLLMFGDEVRDEITSNILVESSYPRALTALMCLCISIIPLTKIPLNARPIVSTVEVLSGLQQQLVDHHGMGHGTGDDSGGGSSVTAAAFWRVVIRLAVVLTFLVISILFPAFDSIMAFMGSALCFTICVSLPLAFYLKLFGHELSVRERIFATTVMIISIVLSIIGTVWAFLPKSLIGAETEL
ncbi:putative amino acid transporter protein [Thermochaetoides thermophila DSM 1495]|uniref:Putative amino acid transporter protein n=1 Tax=Chaetomium thermophilum (strain DSM 1495 / CBS 144.50 / IMI 039719) TaxID=759272 RepID=G0S511_CHATD|nr:putative amino acid transporter protein [Thermochaetoides thermophila DSM 1495]EGS20536.1 putative amino acid transporter protein [Thermochaetoides thermophila DSM 1495]